jgi:hypothetical protein
MRSRNELIHVLPVLIVEEKYDIGSFARTCTGRPMAGTGQRCCAAREYAAL